jgi:uncharacterized protein (TIGR04255 family)
MPKEIYAHAPVQFVSFVAGFPLSPALQAPEGKVAVYERLRDSFPLLAEIQRAQLEVPVGVGGPLQPPIATAIPQQLRMTNRERTRSVTLGPMMACFECTDHESFEGLESVIRVVLEAVVDVGTPAGLLEVTLQYVDEIRHPEALAPNDWTRFVADSVVGPASLLDADVQQTAGVTHYKLSDRHQLRLRYGAAKDGFVVDPNGPLRVKQSGGGPFFSLSFESEWSAPEDGVPSFDVGAIIDTTRELHAPIHGAFEAIIKPELRAYFRGDDDVHN